MERINFTANALSDLESMERRDTSRPFTPQITTPCFLNILNISLLKIDSNHFLSLKYPKNAFFSLIKRP
jgi:hypothetical protein